MNKKYYPVYIDCPTLPATCTYSLPSELVSLTSEPFVYYISHLILKEGTVEFDLPKHLVPSFDKSKSGDTLIAQYSNVEKDVPATISVVLSLDLTTGDIKITGFGFEKLELMVEVPDEDDIYHDNLIFNVKLKDGEVPDFGVSPIADGTPFAAALKRIEDVIDACPIDKEEVVMNKEDAYDASGEDKEK